MPSGVYTRTKKMIFSEEHKRKISEAIKGKTPWNKGLTKAIDDRISNNTGGKNPHETVLKSWITRRKIGHDIGWNKGLTKCTDERVKKNGLAISKSTKNKPLSEKARNYRSNHMKELNKTKIGKKLSREQVRKMLCKREMSSLEIRMNNIIHKNNLPYKFVSNGEFLIENKCPDFINTNGEKIAIEVYCRKHKDMFREGGYLQWMKERTELFTKHGWTIKFFDPIDLQNEQKIINELKA